MNHPNIMRKLGAAIILLFPLTAFAAWTNPAVLNTSSAINIRNESSLHLATDNAGTWLAVWCSNTTITADFDVMFSRSTNNGNTWSAPAVLNTKTPGSKFFDDAASIAPGNSGTWITAWSSNDPLNNTIGDDYDILFARSTNGGTSWSASAALNTDAATDKFQDYNPVVMRGNGSVWVAAWEAYDLTTFGASGPDDDIRFARSTDDGATWGTPSLVNSTALTDSLDDDQAPALATDHNGRWVAVWQSLNELGTTSTHGGDWDIAYAQSSDDGTSWSAMRFLNTNAGTDTGADVVPQIATDGVGNWVCVWASNDSLGGTIGNDDDILFSRSTDNGTTWSAPAALNTNAAVDTGNDSAPAIAYGGGKFICVWQSTDRLGGSYPVDHDIMYSQSTDGGASWSAPALLNSNATTDALHDRTPQIAVDTSGNRVAAWRLVTFGQVDGDMIFSRDPAAGASIKDWSLFD